MQISCINYQTSAPRPSIHYGRTLTQTFEVSDNASLSGFPFNILHSYLRLNIPLLAKRFTVNLFISSSMIFFAKALLGDHLSLFFADILGTTFHFSLIYLAYRLHTFCSHCHGQEIVSLSAINDLAEVLQVPDLNGGECLEFTSIIDGLSYLVLCHGGKIKM